MLRWQLLLAWWGYLGGSVSWPGEDIWIEVLVGLVRIFKCQFCWPSEDIWVAVFAGLVRISGWQLLLAWWRYLGGSFCSPGEDICMSWSGEDVDGGFSWLAENLWVAILSGLVKIFRWQLQLAWWGNFSWWEYLNGSFSWLGEGICVAVLLGLVRIVGCQL